MPAITVDQLTRAETRAFRVPLRQLGKMAAFDAVVLAGEIEAILLTPDLIRMTPFSMAEVDQHLASAALLAAIPDEGDAPPAIRPAAASRVGDLWLFDDGSRMLPPLMADRSGSLFPKAAIDDPIIKRQIEREVRRRLQQQGQHGAAAELMRDQHGSGDGPAGHDGGEGVGGAGDEDAGDDGSSGGT